MFIVVYVMIFTVYSFVCMWFIFTFCLVIFTHPVVTSVNAPRQSTAVTAVTQPQSLQERYVCVVCDV